MANRTSSYCEEPTLKYLIAIIKESKSPKVPR